MRIGSPLTITRMYCGQATCRLTQLVLRASCAAAFLTLSGVMFAIGPDPVSYHRQLSGRKAGASIAANKNFLRISGSAKTDVENEYLVKP